MATKKVTKSKAKTSKPIVKTASAKVVTSAANKKVFNSLKKWNLVLAFVLAAQAVVILFISNTVYQPIVSHFLVPDTLVSQGAGHTVYALAVRHLFDINLAWLVAGFLLVSAVFHAIIATKERSHYEADLARGVNGLRWLDYGISASIMLATIGLINGIYDVSTLMTMIVLVALLHLLGFFGETNAVNMKAKWQSFIGLLAAGGAVWVAVGANMKSAIIYGNGLPQVIYWIDGTIFAITVLLALNTYMIFQSKNRWADYLYGERIYMALSFVAKTALAWLIFAGFLQ